MIISQGYRDSHQHKGEDYHSIFSDCPHTSVLWELEKIALDRILEANFSGKKPRYLDFACGTGRILMYLKDRVTDPVGVDVSESMLAVARRDAPDARFVEADLTRDDPIVGSEFRMITAFRFFPNAEPPLRAGAIQAIIRHLHPDGIFVFNNHLNTTSLMRRIGRFLGRLKGRSMSHDEVVNMVEGAGLTIMRTYSLGLLPMNDRLMLRPVAAALAIENLMSRLFNFPTLAQDIVYVCRRS